MKSALFAVALTFVASAAFAQPAGNPDANGDGRVSLPEFQTFSLTRNLARADTNRDGRVSKAEAAASAGPQGAMINLVWGRMDTNRDDFLTRPELDAMSARSFQRADTNRDGTLDAAELAALRGNRR